MAKSAGNSGFGYGQLHFFGSVDFIPNASQFITHFASVNHNRKKGQTPNINISKSYKINNAEFLKKSENYQRIFILFVLQDLKMLILGVWF